jgi:hypothetical protein
LRATENGQYIAITASTDGCLTQISKKSNAGCCPLQESLAVITNTVTAALAAEVPPGVTRTVYLCDDGKDPAKKEFIGTLGDDAR